MCTYVWVVHPFVVQAYPLLILETPFGPSNRFPPIVDAAREVLSLDLTRQVLTTCKVGSHEMHWFSCQAHFLTLLLLHICFEKCPSIELVTRTLVFVERDVVYTARGYVIQYGRMLS